MNKQSTNWHHSFNRLCKNALLHKKKGAEPIDSAPLPMVDSIAQNKNLVKKICKFLFLKLHIFILFPCIFM